MEKFPTQTRKFLPAMLLLGVLGGHQFSNASAVMQEANLTRVPVVAPAGTVLRVRLNQALDTERSRPGDRFTGVLDSPLQVEGWADVPQGTEVQGHVIDAHKSGRWKGGDL